MSAVVLKTAFIVSFLKKKYLTDLSKGFAPPLELFEI